MMWTVLVLMVASRSRNASVMYHPTTRVLTILELLQAYPQISGAELATRLEVSQRSIRRYVTMLHYSGKP